MRARFLLATLGVAVAGALGGPGPAAARRPEIVAEVGGTAAVEGDPGQGGASVALALLWPLEKHFRLGVVGSVDDFGTRQARLIGPEGDDLGPTSDVHRAALTGAWRLEAHVRPLRGWRAFGTGTWGAYRVADDLRGDVQRRVFAVGGGFGLGLLRSVSASHAVGIHVRFQHLSRGTASRYLSAAAAWRWGSEAPN